VHDGAWLPLWFPFETFDFADERGEQPWVGSNMSYLFGFLF
jgi:hypothetical protein